MPAYSIPLDTPKCYCGKKAKVQVFNTWNASVGFYCGPCGRRKVEELNRA